MAPKRLFVAAIGKPITDPTLLARTRQIVAIRDPRDVLVSNYFSIRSGDCQHRCRFGLDGETVVWAGGGAMGPPPPAFYGSATIAALGREFDGIHEPFSYH